MPSLKSSSIDLAILKVPGVKNIPRPIDCKEAVDCAETMPVYSFGFPFGDVLSTSKGNPAVTVGKATISSLRNDDAGDLALVQIDGSLNPGNSGGPVVDVRGRLVGVAVATIRNSSGIGLAIPGRKVPSMWEGHLGQPHLVLLPGADDAPFMVATVDVFDPLHKLKTVSLSFLSADRLTDKPKPADRLKDLPACHEMVLKIGEMGGRREHSRAGESRSNGCLVRCAVAGNPHNRCDQAAKLVAARHRARSSRR